jgi:hypothetical protein
MAIVLVSMVEKSTNNVVIPRMEQLLSNSSFLLEFLSFGLKNDEI